MNERIFSMAVLMMRFKAVRKKDKKIEMLYKKLYQNFRYKEVNLK
jgi:hypothetical protein